MIYDNLTLIGIIFFVFILVIIGVSIGSKVFEDQPWFALAVIISELCLALLAFENPWIFRAIAFLFGIMLVIATLLSSIFLGIETLLLGFPSLALFIYSFFVQKNHLWINILSACLFFVGLIVSQLELREPLSEILGDLFIVFIFSLAIVGVFLIPTIFPQFELITQIVELIGTITGIILYILGRIRR